MPVFTIMFGDIEDPGAGPDLGANAAFIQGGLDECAKRIRSGVYGNEGSIQRIVGNYQFPGYPYCRASADGTPDVNDRPTNGMHVTMEQWRLDIMWNGHIIDALARRRDDGSIEYGWDMSNFSGVPRPEWFQQMWDDPHFPMRFIMFGDQFPYIARAQVANAEATGLSWEFQLYTYFNMPGGEFYAGRDGSEQMRDALDQMGIPPAALDAPAPSAPPLIAVRAELQQILASTTEAIRLVG